MPNNPLITAPTTNEELLNLWFEGDRKAFEAFYARHNGRVRAYCLKKGIPKEDAEDVMQEAFFCLHKKIHLYERGRKAMPWFFTIVHNNCMDWYKKNKIKQNCNVYIEEISNKINLPNSNNTPEFHNEENLVQLEKAFHSLNEGEKNLFILRNEKELSFKNISEQTGKNEASLRKAYQRTLLSIKKILKGLKNYD